jgi:ribonucleoside-diphosphate reductase alpha chain
MYERLLSGGNITLFSPQDVPDLYDAFFVDVDKFRDLYEKAEKNPKIRKKSIPAIELFSTFMQERKDTGRIYLMNVDHVNDHGSFIKEVAPIKMSNLCQEISLPTVPLNDINDPEGEIALCTLSAKNWGKVKKPTDFEKPCTLMVRVLDCLLDYQDYPVLAAKISTMNRRPLGIGIINFAYWLAKNGTNYSEPNLDLVHQYTEAWSYYLIKASVDLAEEFGACPKSHETKYAQGIMPIDTYKKEVDELVQPVYRMDWETLRERAKKFGIRNSTLMALMPAECQSLNNEVMMCDGTPKRLDDIITEYGLIDIDTVHDNMMIGQRFQLAKPVKLIDSIAYECYYNGPRSVTEIEFEDGKIYRFTDNHKLMVNRDGTHLWIEVKDLLETDDVVTDA